MLNVNFVFKKILFVNPGRNNIYASNEPLNLAFLSSFLEENGVDVQIADQLSGESVEEKAEKFRPDVVGVTSTTTMIKDAVAVADYFRDKKVPTIIGGVHATTFPEDVSAAFDIVVQGEGEFPLLDIMRDGRERGVVKSSEVVDIDRMPRPARHLLNNDYYLNIKKKFPQDGNYFFVPHRERLLSVMISRGCPWNCAFCHNVWRDIPFRIYSPDKVLEELIDLKTKFGLRYFIFRDDNIYASRVRIKRILEAIIDADLGLLWGANARADCLDDEILFLSRRAGCVRLNFGFESGSQRMLDDLNKKIKLSTVYAAVDSCRKFNIMVSGSFIVGHPRETLDDIQETVRMIRRLKLDSIGVAIATPFPNTKWWRIAEEKGLVGSDIEWEKFDFDNVPIRLNTEFTVKQLKRFQRRYYFEAFRANPVLLYQMLGSSLVNPHVMFRRARNVLWGS